MKYTDLLPDVLALLATDPSEPVAIIAARNTVIDFCGRSWLWRAYGDPISVEAGVASYDVEIPAGTHLVTVMSVRLAGVPLDPTSEVSLDEKNPTWQSDSATPKQYSMLTPETIELAPVPDSNYPNGLVIQYALQPNRAATTFPDWIGDDFWEGLVAGTASRLMLMPGKPWTDGKAGAYYRDQFDSAVAEAKVWALRGLVRAPTRTTSQH